MSLAVALEAVQAEALASRLVLVVEAEVEAVAVVQEVEVAELVVKNHRSRYSIFHLFSLSVFHQIIFL